MKEREIFNDSNLRQKNVKNQEGKKIKDLNEKYKKRNC